MYQPQQEAYTGLQTPTEKYKVSQGLLLGQPPLEPSAQADISGHKTVRSMGRELDTLKTEFEVHRLTGNQLIVRQLQFDAAVRTTWIWWYTACI